MPDDRFPPHATSRMPPHLTPTALTLPCTRADGDLVHDLGGVGVRDDPRKEQPTVQGLGVHGADRDAGDGGGHHHHARRGGSSTIVVFP